ncbi:Phosphopantetheine_adenylyltransferase [Hexamita inflata]|uniref:Phosphopantetheine adenylyltransferase n=1 Tax=Hexamita inflata TaxID=28002 RepID=A0AA86RNM4_9EUKA|nr:Phosphopantetheine adenylyltransferase [Hexamita inflata]CAI9978113.1 Phosphopantetheine adenylyltransferase [Hexamita inflata]
MSFQTVIFGGTFDRIHDGHRLMFQKAVDLVQNNGTIIIGLTGQALLENKAHKDKILSYEQRLLNVTNELRQLTNKQFELTFDEINTKDGSATINEYENGALIVSEETLKGGEHINEVRTQKGLKTLFLAVVGLVKSPNGDKLSSTQIREKE